MILARILDTIQKLKQYAYNQAHSSVTHKKKKQYVYFKMIKYCSEFKT